MNTSIRTSFPLLAFVLTTKISDIRVTRNKIIRTRLHASQEEIVDSRIGKSVEYRNIVNRIMMRDITRDDPYF